MWSFSSELHTKVDDLKNSVLSQFGELNSKNYDKEKWVKLMKCSQKHLLADKHAQTIENNCLQYISQPCSLNHSRIEYSNDSVWFDKNEITTESKNDDKNLVEKPVSKLVLISNNVSIKKPDDCQIIDNYLQKETELDEDDLREVFKIAANSNTAVDYVMQAIGKFQEPNTVNSLYEIFISTKPNNLMMKSFLNFVIRPMVFTTEKSRYLDQCLISCFKNFTNEVIDLIIMPILLNFDEKKKSTLLLMINIACDGDRHYILNTFLDHESLSLQQIPILEKLLSTHMEGPLITKLIVFINNYKDTFSNAPAFGIFLLKIVKLTNTKIKADDKILLENIIRSNSSSYKKTIMKMMEMN